MENILVVDDQANIRRIYANLLTHEGFFVATAASASEANEILKQEKIDLVLLDLRMSGASGSILYEVMRLFHKKVKVLVSSVYHLDKQRRMVPGATGYFDKSEGIGALLARIREALELPLLPQDSVCACPAAED